MPLTLELPPQLGEELEEEAEKAGISPEEHATLLLFVVTAVLKEEGSAPVADEMRRLISERASNPELALSAFEKLVSNAADMFPRLRQQLRSMRAGRRKNAEQERPSAMGKYAHVPGTSDDFAREKQAEIEREERKGR